MSKHETNYQLSYEQMAAHERAVARGVKLLDRHVPGWWKEINLNTLDLEDCGMCVVGQAVENRMAMIPSIAGMSSRYGFDVLWGYRRPRDRWSWVNPKGLVNEYYLAAYAYLEECWTRAVKDKFANEIL